jgi:hypothetical protein
MIKLNIKGNIKEIQNMMKMKINYEFIKIREVLTTLMKEKTLVLED